MIAIARSPNSQNRLAVFQCQAIGGANCLYSLQHKTIGATWLSMLRDSLSLARPMLTQGWEQSALHQKNPFDSLSFNCNVPELSVFHHSAKGLRVYLYCLTPGLQFLPSVNEGVSLEVGR